MQTISSNKSLIYWAQNSNGSNISQVSKLFLKDDYLTVFQKLLDFAKQEGPRKKFIERWHEVCNEISDVVKRKNHNLSPTPNDEQIFKVVTKFRGNLGEIMIEKIIEIFGTIWDLMPGTYQVVDPQHERFVDGEAKYLGDGLPIGIQIKNFSKHGSKENCVDWVPFMKSTSMTAFWIQNDKRIANDKILNFLSIPRQYIISFTSVEDNRNLKDYSNSVKFIGPEDFDDKFDLKRKYYIFEQICNEIKALN